ncbi:biopolymer transporter ExbD [Longimonas halophila]|uniref:Biopolymer transporter ExbD n=1 Tax=Longimonas halophila TaxID=1469170 RepID=A0A2H3NQR3_9BACT|nr:biopolymer transporter ExbD [Longimonas halophila]PEN08013.1 biopolymer transporter ExbD [Longimonas halophila]
MAGLLDKRRSKREDAETPTSSMADIAFLLLIFFLVTTTINVDTGIGMTLPPQLEQEEPPPVQERNLLRVLVNASGEVLIDDNMSSVNQIREEVKTHVLNYGENADYSDSPSDAVISLKTDAQTPYRIYIDVLDEIQMAYREIYNSIARSGNLPSGESVLDETYESYEAYRESLEPEDDDLVRESFPRNISIAEPDSGN